MPDILEIVNNTEKIFINKNNINAIKPEVIGLFDDKINRKFLGFEAKIILLFNDFKHNYSFKIGEFKTKEEAEKEAFKRAKFIANQLGNIISINQDNINTNYINNNSEIDGATFIKHNNKTFLNISNIEKIIPKIYKNSEDYFRVKINFLFNNANVKNINYDLDYNFKTEKDALIIAEKIIKHLEKGYSFEKYQNF